MGMKRALDIRDKRGHHPRLGRQFRPLPAHGPLATLPLRHEADGRRRHRAGNIESMFGQDTTERETNHDGGCEYVNFCLH
jgi:hypothetical protein